MLTKLTGDDDVEAFLEVFERTAQGEKWLQEEWGRILTPFLTGRPRELTGTWPGVDAHQNPTLKAAILAKKGCSLSARALRDHNWSYNSDSPVWAQVSDLAHRAHSWLVEGEGPPLLE